MIETVKYLYVNCYFSIAGQTNDVSFIITSSKWNPLKWRSSESNYDTFFPFLEYVCTELGLSKMIDKQDFFPPI